MLSNFKNLLIFTEKNPDAYTDLFKEFCASSSIHGTYFFHFSKSNVSKIIWIGVVGIGIILAGVAINSSFQEWKKHPVITSVAQIPIEEIDFPSVTICPLVDSRYILNYSNSLQILTSFVVVYL